MSRAVARRPASRRKAALIAVTGAVQGTGFRPFAWRLAHSLGLAGWIRNTPDGVQLHVEGERPALDAFAARLVHEAPPAAVLRLVTVRKAMAADLRGFAIAGSETGGAPRAAILPDLATCPDCRRELFDPADRRYRYPFLNCTACGPRLTIIEELPYDRPRTAMRAFALCEACAAEYGDPADRRFHAQPVACPRCGPRLVYEGPDGHGLAPLDAAVRLVRQGGILALRGLGGYQLVVDARDEAAVARLRERKGRGAKPFAVMFPDLAAARREAVIEPVEADVLESVAAPILLLPRAPASALCDAVAPGLRTLGAMLPYSPLHHLLLHELGFPVVMTSGNLAEEPMALEPAEARRRLGRVADGFVHHDRPVVRAVDDSVVRSLGGQPRVLRRARGYAPLPLPLAATLPVVRALGGHLKNAVAWTVGDGILASQHIGDLDHPLSLAALHRTVADYERLYRLRPVAVACDLHPDYATTRIAEASGLPVVRVQHHHAHVAAVLAEHDLSGEVLGVAWDGTGYGPDGTVWGGEFLLVSRTCYRRVARLRPFRLCGGEAAGRQPWRSALGVLHELVGPDLWQLDVAPVRRAAADAAVLAPLLASGACTVRTSSAGRLFDAAASLLDLVQDCTYEAQAAMLLEQAALPLAASPYPFTLRERSGDEPPLEVDWRPTAAAMLEDVRRGVPRERVAARFHASMARMAAAAADWAGLPRVVLSGGCFQNALLAGLTARHIADTGADVITPHRVPANDGGLAIGQALVAASLVRARED